MAEDIGAAIARAVEDVERRLNERTKEAFTSDYFRALYRSYGDLRALQARWEQAEEIRAGDRMRGPTNTIADVLQADIIRAFRKVEE